MSHGTCSESKGQVTGAAGRWCVVDVGGSCVSVGENMATIETIGLLRCGAALPLPLNVHVFFSHISVSHLLSSIHDNSTYFFRK